MNCFYEPCPCCMTTGTVWVSTAFLCPLVLQRQESCWSSFFSLCMCIWTFPSNESKRASWGHGNWSPCLIWAFLSKPKRENMPQLCKEEEEWELHEVYYVPSSLPSLICHYREKAGCEMVRIDWQHLTHHREWFCLCSTIHVFPSCPCV